MCSSLNMTCKVSHTAILERQQQKLNSSDNIVYKIPITRFIKICKIFSEMENAGNTKTVKKNLRIKFTAKVLQAMLNSRSMGKLKQSFDLRIADYCPNMFVLRTLEHVAIHYSHARDKRFSVKQEK